MSRPSNLVQCVILGIVYIPTPNLRYMMHRQTWSLDIFGNLGNDTVNSSSNFWITAFLE